MNEKLLVFRDDERIRMSRAIAEGSLNLLQSVIDEAKKLGLKVPADNFYNIVTKPVKWVRERFAEMIPQESVGAFKVKREIQLDSLELPDTTEFVKACEAFLRHVRGHFVPVNLITIDKGRASINEEAMGELTESASRYVSHPKSKEIYQSLANVVDALNKFNAIAQKECGIFGINAESFKDFVKLIGDKKSTHGLKLCIEPAYYIGMTTRFEEL